MARVAPEKVVIHRPCLSIFCGGKGYAMNISQVRQELYKRQENPEYEIKGPEWRPKHVYAMYDGHTSVKFGITINLQTRLEAMQTANPGRLEILAHIPGRKRLEWLIHDALKHLKRRGEWFWYRGEAANVVSLMSAGDEAALREYLLELIYAR